MAELTEFCRLQWGCIVGQQTDQSPREPALLRRVLIYVTEQLRSIIYLHLVFANVTTPSPWFSLLEF